MIKSISFSLSLFLIGVPRGLETERLEPVQSCISLSQDLHDNRESRWSYVSLCLPYDQLVAFDMVVVF